VLEAHQVHLGLSVLLVLQARQDDQVGVGLMVQQVLQEVQVMLAQLDQRDLMEVVEQLEALELLASQVHLDR